MKLAGKFFQLATKTQHLNWDCKSRVGAVSETGDTHTYISVLTLKMARQWSTTEVPKIFAQLSLARWMAVLNLRDQVQHQKMY